ncbi:MULTISPECIES: universal stress protein [Paracoccaceae]|jgi:nucleotide-binding universal stress UspA family protein|uniref:universal stress protein n=1 Tax=Rhodobacterales TaxID=204455 RepID=UPI001B0919BB|nr:universal stress protein [Boseongicola sp. H5]MBO6624370.1 universal stress protein [Roseicyclus sp.]MBO6922594.1 universal stress protein [Roseicyclus sp.]
MAYKSILTVLTDTDEVGPVLEAILPFARAEGAHLDVLCMGVDRTQTGYYFAGATALMHDETLAQAQALATQIETGARTLLERTDISWGIEALVTQTASVAGIVARRARFSDLVVLPKPYGENQASDAPVVVEAAMFQGQAPAIVLPGDVPVKEALDRIVVAWNESAEALCAVRAALPLLKAAKLVNILIIDPQRHAAEVSDPGAELSKMLSRHGVEVEVSIVAQTLPRVSDVINRHIQDQNADLLVMGAYGHSRFREAILGGATRNLLENAVVPVLMAH